jgi:GDSL-like Lipase/Acylhydrolase family
MRRRTVAEILTLLIVAASVGVIVARRRRPEADTLVTSTPLSRQSMLSVDDSRPEALTVAVVGDSIIYMSELHIRTALDGPYWFTVRAHPGAKLGDIEDLTDSLPFPGRRFPDAIVINLGTNDVTGKTTEWLEQWTTLMHRLAPVPRLILFTINRHADLLGDQCLDRPSAKDINGAIARAGEAANVVVIDWDAAVQSDVELVWDRCHRRGDFVHPSAKGQQWIADRIQEALADCSHTPERTY